MNFEDFAADTDNTVVLKASEPESNGTIKFIISTQIPSDHLKVKNPVNVEDSLKICEARRETIVAACQRAFRREPSHLVTLVNADFEDSAQEPPPQPPTQFVGSLKARACARWTAPNNLLTTP